MSLILGLLLAGWLALAVYTVVKFYLASRRPKNFPPGPPTVPFLGNLHQIPLSKAFLKYMIHHLYISLLTIPLDGLVGQRIMGVSLALSLGRKMLSF
jgi:hypothetical protein